MAQGAESMEHGAQSMGHGAQASSAEAQPRSRKPQAHSRGHWISGKQPGRAPTGGAQQAPRPASGNGWNHRCHEQATD